MSGNLEFNKICSAFLIFGVLVLGASLLVDSFYTGHSEDSKEKGYQIDVSDLGSNSSAEAEQKDPFEGVDFDALLKIADASKGQKIFNKCTACHTITKDGANRVGPGLWGVVGRKIGHKSDFNYSKAFKAHGGAWTNEQLFRYLHKPAKYMPGTRMVFAGISDFKQLADLIAYLDTLRG